MSAQNTRRQFLKAASLLGMGLAAAGETARAAAPPAAGPAAGPDRGTAPRPPAQAEVMSGIAIQNAAIVDTRDGSIARGMTVVVDAGRIQQIGPTPSIRLGGTAQAVDAEGKYVVPGFLDMHTHVFEHSADSPSDFQLLLANGVTGIREMGASSFREMGGSPEVIRRARQLNANIAAGRVDAPEVLVIPSDIFFGLEATTVDGAVQFVQDRLDEGADFIKIVAGSREVFLTVLAEARKRGSYAAGHIPPAVGALEASNLGFYFEHLGAGWGLLIDCARDEASIRQDALANPAPPAPLDTVLPLTGRANWAAPYYQRIIDTFDEAKCQALAQAFVANGTWQTPTLVRIRAYTFGDDPRYSSDPNLIYINKTRRALWEQRGQTFAETVTPETRATFAQFYPLQQRVTGLLKQQGVKMLSGSDLGGGWVFPGFGLHQEFRELAASGLTPLEILQMTTLNGAEFLGRQATMGTVEVGKNADLVLLDDNPIADVANLDKIAAVFLRGKHYPRAALDKLKSDAAAAYAAQPLRDLRTALAQTHDCCGL